MKKLITIFLLIFAAASCTTQKHKTKAKTTTEFRERKDSSRVTAVIAENTLQTAKKDSSVSQTDFSGSKTFASFAQNLSLKNNGKCADGGEIRFLKYTDARGNITEVPMNDNTDLSFNTMEDLTKENKSLKSQLNQLTTDNSNLKSKLDEKTKKEGKSDRTENADTLDATTDKETNSFMSYVWCAVLSIVLWEVIVFFFKSYF